MILDERERARRIIKEVSGVKAQYGITQWEWEFLQKMAVMARAASDKQRRIVGELERRVFGETKPE